MLLLRIWASAHASPRIGSRCRGAERCWAGALGNPNTDGADPNRCAADYNTVSRNATAMRANARASLRAETAPPPKRFQKTTQNVIKEPSLWRLCICIISKLYFICCIYHIITCIYIKVISEIP